MAGPTIEEAVISFLLADSTVTQAVGQEVRPRFNQGQTFPRIAVGRNGDGVRLKGMNVGRTGNAQALLQLDYLANTGDAATRVLALANYVGTKLDGYQGNMAIKVFVRGMFLRHDPQNIIPPVHGDEVGVESISQLFFVKYYEN